MSEFPNTIEEILWSPFPGSKPAKRDVYLAVKIEDHPIGNIVLIAHYNPDTDNWSEVDHIGIRTIKNVAFYTPLPGQALKSGKEQ